MTGPSPKDNTEVTASPRDVGPRLLAVWPGGQVVRELPETGSLEIGRGEETDIRIDHASVSRRHARLTVGAELRIEDLGSSNGTFVEGKRLAPNDPQVVRPDTSIEIGTVMVVVRGAGAPLRSTPNAPVGVVICDPEMERVHQLVELAAPSDLSILLLGETGVGKDVVATRVHVLSKRASGPFLKINCAALVESLLEAELFGYEKGAFTGATSAKAGLLESAGGGTLFLDEVGEMPIQTQAKLLRALESGEITRVGSTKARTVDVRYVAATNQDLKKNIKEGRFRQDLYFRLEGIAIRVPPLRARPSEIGPLVRAFAAEASKSRGGPPIGFSDAAMMRLVRHPWPGNVRELKNLVARSVLLTTKAVLDDDDLHFEPMALGSESERDAIPADPVEARARTGVPAGAISTEERQRIVDALEQCGGNQTRAAKLLGISRGTLVNRLNLIDLPRPRK
jgi:transcriptional regulator with PAS, ATPase and Fis domain